MVECLLGIYKALFLISGIPSSRAWWSTCNPSHSWLYTQFKASLKYMRPWDDKEEDDDDEKEEEQELLG